jgi:integrase
MVAKRDLTDKELKVLLVNTDDALRKRGIDPQKSRPIVWDAQVPNFGVRLTDSRPPQLSFVLVTRFPGGNSPVPRQIGGYPAVELAKARHIAREWREDIQKGVDPKSKADAVRRVADADRREEARRAKNTFDAAFSAYCEEHLSKLRTGSVVDGVIKKHVLPVLGTRSLSEITRSDANELLKRIAKATPTHARRIRSYLQTFGRWAEDDERIAESPFANLRRLGKETPRERVLSDLEIRAIWSASAQLGAFGRAFRLMLVTGQRRSEVGDLDWREIDEAKRLWTLPRGRTKADREHEVPLSDVALSILEECPRFGEHVFATRAPRARDGEPKPKASTTPLSGWSKAKSRLDELALAEIRKLTGDDKAELTEWHLHDLRRTCATFLARLKVERIVISKVLNHAEGGVTQVYDRYAYQPEKRRALVAWSNALSNIVEGRPFDKDIGAEAAADNVVPFVVRA